MEDKKLAFTKIYEEYADALFRYCYFRISDREKAVDMVQDIFTKTWNYLNSGNEVENIKAFLYTTARNVIIDEYRKKKSSSLDVILEQGIEFASKEGLSQEVAYDAKLAINEINKLPDTYRDILFMRFVNDMSVQDIAKICNVSENVVSVRIHRGMQKLRSNLDTI